MTMRFADHNPSCHLVIFNGKCNCGEDERWEIDYAKFQNDKEKLLYPHKHVIINGIQIDEQLAPLIQKLWNAGVETTNCCQGNNITDGNRPFIVFTSEGNYSLSYQDGNGDHRFLAYLIFKKQYYDIVKKLLPSDTKFLIGKDCNVQNGMDCLWKDLAWAHWRHYE